MAEEELSFEGTILVSNERIDCCASGGSGERGPDDFISSQYVCNPGRCTCPSSMVRLQKRILVALNNMCRYSRLYLSGTGFS